MKSKIENKFYEMLGQFDGYYTHPPLDDRKLYYNSEELVKFLNDGSEVWLGSRDSWYTHMRHKEFRKIVLWYLYQVILVDWCGLRSFIWYKLLGRKCKQTREFVRRELEQQKRETK
jgi:hypothetical protein